MSSRPASWLGTTGLTVGALACALGCENSRTRDRIYVTSGAGDAVYILAAEDGQIVDSIPIDPRPGESDEPHGIVVTDRHWYVTASHGEPTIWKFELPSNRLVGRARLGLDGAGRIGVTPNGTLAFVPDYYRDGGSRGGRMAVIALHDLEILARPAVCRAPHDAQVNAAGTLVAITCTQSDEVVVVDVGTLEPIRRFPLAEGASDRPRSSVVRPLNLVWSPDGADIYVTLHMIAQVARLTLDDSPPGQLSVGRGPAQLAMTRRGDLLVVANRMDGSVSIVDVPALTEVTRVDLGVPHPHGVALSPDDRVAYVSYEGTTAGLGGVVAVDLQRRAVAWSREAGSYTLGVTYVTHRRATVYED